MADAGISQAIPADGRLAIGAGVDERGSAIRQGGELRRDWQHNHGHVDHGNPADLVTVHDVDAEQHYQAAEARARSGRQAADPRAPPSATSVGSAPGGSTDGGGISPSPPPPPPNTRAAGITRSPPF